MCTIGGLSRHIGRQSTDISVDSRPIDYRYIDRQSTNASPDMYTFIGRLSVDNRPIVDRQSTEYRPTVGRCISRYVHIYRSTVGRFIGRLSVDCRPIVDLQSVNSRPIYWPICRPRPPIVHMTQITSSPHFSFTNFGGISVFLLEILTCHNCIEKSHINHSGSK